MNFFRGHPETFKKKLEAEGVSISMPCDPMSIDNNSPACGCRLYFPRHDQRIFDYAVISAGLNMEPKTFIGENGALKIMLTSEERYALFLLPSITRRFQHISMVVAEWIKVYESPLPILGPELTQRYVLCLQCSAMIEEAVSSDEKSPEQLFRFRRGILLYWCYCRWADLSSTDDPAIKYGRLVDQFSNFQIAEMLAVQKYFVAVMSWAGLPLARQSYFNNRDPHWLLQSDNRRVGFGSEENREEQKTITDHLVSQLYSRGLLPQLIDAGYLTDEGHKRVMVTWTSLDIDGDSRVTWNRTVLTQRHSLV